jgi:hypothetical protein
MRDGKPERRRNLPAGGATDPDRQTRDRREREGDPRGIDKSWHGTDEASGHGAYVGPDFGRDARESDAPSVPTRAPYFATRMGDWDEGEQNDAAAAEERGRHATADDDGPGAAVRPLPRRSAGSARRRRDRTAGR